MPMRSWTARLPLVYDVAMKPIEHLGMRDLRARLWSELPQDGDGLEVGAGSGAGGAFRPALHEVAGSDISHAMLLRARARTGGARPLVTADVQALPFRDGAFDWVVGSLLFCEVTDPLRGLREVRRVLRPGGSLHLLEHVLPRGALLGAAARAVTRVSGPLFGEHWDRVTHETVARAGFTIDRADWRMRGALVHLIAHSEAE